MADSTSHVLRFLATTDSSLITSLASNLSRGAQTLTCSRMETLPWSPAQGAYDVSEKDVKG